MLRFQQRLKAVLLLYSIGRVFAAATSKGSLTNTSAEESGSKVNFDFVTPRGMTGCRQDNIRAKMLLCSREHSQLHNAWLADVQRNGTGVCSALERYRSCVELKVKPCKENLLATYRDTVKVYTDPPHNCPKPVAQSMMEGRAVSLTLTSVVISAVGVLSAHVLKQ